MWYFEKACRCDEKHSLKTSRNRKGNRPADGLETGRSEKKERKKKKKREGRPAFLCLFFFSFLLFYCHAFPDPVVPVSTSARRMNSVSSPRFKDILLVLGRSVLEDVLPVAWELKPEFPGVLWPEEPPPPPESLLLTVFHAGVMPRAEKSL
jgi:hypothetical protein